MQDRLRSIWTNPVYRRDALKIGVAFALGSLVKSMVGPGSAENPESPVAVTTVVSKEKTLDVLLQEILDIPPFLRAHVGNPERIRKENEYVGRVSQNLNLSDIDKGFWVLTHQPARAELLELRYNLRQSGKEQRLGQIPQEKLEWAKQWGIHPEVLGAILDNYPHGEEKIAALNDKNKLRDDGYELKEPGEGMINIGGLAMLITKETGPINFLGESFGFTNIGQDMAINQIFGESAQKDKSALERIAETFFRKTKLRLNPKNIAGSVKGLNDDSGGAIATQFRPENADKFEKLVESVTGDVLNVFDINDALVMIWVFLARHEYVGKDIYGRDAYRVGYRKGVPKDITNAIVKWFGAPGEPSRKTEAAAYDYYDNFLDPKLKDKGKTVYTR